MVRPLDVVSPLDVLCVSLVVDVLGVAVLGVTVVPGTAGSLTSVGGGADRMAETRSPSMPDEDTLSPLACRCIDWKAMPGADIVSVSKFAGHSKVLTTLDLYAHEVQERERKTESLLGVALGGAL